MKDLSALFSASTVPANSTLTNLRKTQTKDGAPQHIFGDAVFRDSGGAIIGTKPVTIEPGTIQGWLTAKEVTRPKDYNPDDHDGDSWPEYEFKRLWAEIPYADPAVAATVEAAIPDAFFKRLWDGA